jgi:hypothetical protein
MATLGVALSAASTIFGGVSDFAQGSYQSKVAKHNAALAEMNALEAFDAGQIEAMDNDKQTAMMLGEQSAAQSASGLSLSGKSASAIRRSSRIIGRTDSLRIAEKAARESTNFRQEAADFRAEGRAAKATGTWKLAGSVLSAGAQLAGGQPSMVSDAQPSALNKRMVIKPVLRPSRLRDYYGSLEYGGPR